MVFKLMFLFVFASIPRVARAGNDSSDVDISFFNDEVTEAKRSQLNDDRWQTAPAAIQIANYGGVIQEYLI